MKYPMINRQPRREVNVPQLSGGLNLRDSLTGIRDNQMTDCVNMWYKEGMLRTRPGFVTNEDLGLTIKRAQDEYFGEVKTHLDIKKDGKTLVSIYRRCGIKGDGTSWCAHISFWWHDETHVESAGEFSTYIPSFEWNGLESLINAMKDFSYFVTCKDGVVYCFVTNGKNDYLYKLDYEKSESEWEFIDWHEYYVPTVYAHCLPTNNGWSFTATQFEAYNSLCDSYKMVYSLYNPSCEKHPMIYGLGNINVNDSYIIEATIIKQDGNEEKYLVEKSSLYSTAQSKKQNDEDKIMTVVFDNDYQYITFSNDSDYQNSVIELTEEDNYAEDNLIITISPSHPFENQNRSKIFNMTQSAWFGGAANGINGGSRLFLCGNTDEKEKSLVVWSSLNNPLYFPENNYAYVGDKSQGVTAFGQQGENLIIFKGKSTYYSYYNVNDNITADDLINQSVVDYEANSAIFPMIQLNANIGCDCPNTVQLCRNRLVWANSDGNVYTLYSNNQYSERTIYKISDMINSMLKKENDLKNAVSCDFEGHYLLCVGNKIYVMDYNSYGYQYAASFSKNEDSNVQIPWYIWEISAVGKLFSMNNKLMQMNSYDTSDGVMLTFSTLSADENTANDNILFFNQNDELEIVEKKINSKLQTKLFDFSAAGYLKNVDRVSIAFGNNGGEPINVSFLTDKGSESDVVTLIGSSTDERDAAFVTVKNFYVSARAVRTFGVKIECEGPLIIDGLSLQYRMLGGVK